LVVALAETDDPEYELGVADADAVAPVKAPCVNKEFPSESIAVGYV